MGLRHTHAEWSMKSRIILSASILPVFGIAVVMISLSVRLSFICICIQSGS